jgi:hypothetical protein
LAELDRLYSEPGVQEYVPQAVLASLATGGVWRHFATIFHGRHRLRNATRNTPRSSVRSRRKSGCRRTMLHPLSSSPVWQRNTRLQRTSLRAAAEPPSRLGSVDMVGQLNRLARLGEPEQPRERPFGGKHELGKRAP